MKYFFKILLAVFVFTSSHVNAASPLDGTWKIVQAVGGPGLQEGIIFEEAQTLLGQEILFAGGKIRFANGKLCQATGSSKHTLDDFDPSFGNYGAHWDALGLKSTDRDRHLYDVMIVSIDCPNSTDVQDQYRDLIIANQGTLFLMAYKGQYLKIEKIPE